MTAKARVSRDQNHLITFFNFSLLAFWPFSGLLTAFLGGSPTVIWPWEGFNYPSQYCNGRTRPKGPKFKKKISVNSSITLEATHGRPNPTARPRTKL